MSFKNHSLSLSHKITSLAQKFYSFCIKSKVKSDRITFLASTIATNTVTDLRLLRGKILLKKYTFIYLKKDC